MTTAQGFRQFSTNEHFSFPHSEIISCYFFTSTFISIKRWFILLAARLEFLIGLSSRRLDTLKKRRYFTFACKSNIVPVQEMGNMNFYMIGKHFIF